MSNLDWNLVLQGPYHDQLVQGLFLSLRLAAWTALLALPLAAVVAVARLSPHRVWRALGGGFVDAIRHVPLLAHVLFWYFAAPEFLPDALKQWLYRGSFEAAAAIVALTLYSAAYLAEDMRSGVRSVRPGQLAAALALGLSFTQAMRHVILPQALRFMLPTLISQGLNLWKNTSMAMVIGVADLMYQAQQVESATFRSFEAFAFATGGYLMVSLLITALAQVVHHLFPPRAA